MPTKAERVQALITNAASPYAATDAEILTAYSDDQLSALEQVFQKMGMPAKTEAAPAAGSVVATVTPIEQPAIGNATAPPAQQAPQTANAPVQLPVAAAAANQPRNLQEYVARLPQPIQDIVNRQLAAEQKHRDTIIADLTAVQKKLTAHQLAAKPTDELETLHELLAPPPSYLGAAGLATPWTAPATRTASAIDHTPPSSWNVPELGAAPVKSTANSNGTAAK